MKVSSLLPAAALIALAACSSSQPAPLGEADLNAMFGKGAQVEFGDQGNKGTMTFFADKTVSREVAGKDQIDDGTWRIAGGKLCIAWKTPAAAESCLNQVKVGSTYEARKDDGSVAMTYTLK